MKIGIIVAMEKELHELQKVFGDDPRYVILQCGIGKVNAAIGAAEMIREHHPDAIISSGCAGGNGDNLKVQDVVVSTELAYHDVYCGEAVDGSCVYGQVQGMPARFKADEHLLAVARQLSIANDQLSIHPGLIVTGDWFVDSREKMKAIVVCYRSDLPHLRSAVHLVPDHQRHPAERHQRLPVSRFLVADGRPFLPRHPRLR